MKCRICGANLAKENADICVECYKKYQEEEDLKKDNNEVYRVSGSFAVGYSIVKHLEIILIIIIAMIGCFVISNISAGICGLGFLIIYLVVMFLNDRLKGKNDRIVFYETKLMYHTKNILITDDKIIKYTDIVDIKPYQTFKQKIFGRGDLCIYVKGVLPGGSLIGGAQIKDVKNIVKVCEDISQIFSLKRE